MKHLTVLAAAMAMGLAFHAHAKSYTPVFTEDFESTSPFASGWTWYGSAHKQAERTLIDGTTKSQFLYITGTKYERGDYAFNNDCTALTDYRLEFDWFANMGYGGKTCRLICYAGESELFHVADPNPGNATTSYLFINGADTEDTANAVATFTSANRGADCTGASNQKYWYHITITANETDGVFLKIASQDSSVGTVYNARISDFTHVTKIAFTADSSGYNTNGGIDDIVFSQGTSESFVWTGANGNNTWSTPGNWTVDGVAQTEKYPVLGDTATIGDNITVAVETGAVLPSVTLGDSSALSFDVSGFAEKTAQRLLAYCGSTLASSQIALTGITASDYAVEYETTDEGAVYATLWPKTYFVWSGNGSDTLWTTIGNWVYGNGDAAESCPGDGATVVFPSSLLGGATVTLNADASAAAIVVDAAVSLDSAGTTRRTVYPRAVSGSGGLTIGNVKVQTPTYANVEISCDVAVADSAASFYLRGQNAKMTLSGALTGSGTLKLDADGNGGHSYTVTGDLSGFSGTLEIPQVLRSNAAGCSYNFNGEDATIDLSGATVSIADPMTMTLGGTYDNNILKIGALSGSGTIKNNTANAMTLQVGSDGTDAESSAVLSVADGTGAWTVAKTCANTQSLTDATVAYNVSVSGGTLKLPVGKALGTVAVSGGTLGFAADDAWEIGTAYDLFTYATWASPAESALTLDQSALAKICVPSYDFETAGTVKVTLSEATFTWNGGASGRWDDASNWLIAGAAATAAPGDDNLVTIDGATVFVDLSQSFAKVTLDNGAKLALGFTDDTLSYTIPEGRTASDFVVAGPYTMAESEGVLTATRVPSSFAWAGGSSGEWSDTANWMVDGMATGVIPTSGDTAVFSDDVSATLSASHNVSNLVVATGKTLTLNGGMLANIYEYGTASEKGGTVALNGSELRSYNISDSSASWYGDIEIAGGASVTNYIRATISTMSASGTLNLYGNLSGDGCVVLHVVGHNSGGQPDGRGGVSLYGDNTDFEGICYIKSGASSRGPATFCSATAGSAKARWVYLDSTDGNQAAKSGTISVEGSTIKLGTYEGKNYIFGSDAHTGNTIEIGGANLDFACSLSARSSAAERANNSATLKKVGVGTMTFGEEVGNPCFNTYEMNGGVLKFANMYITKSATGQSSYINPTFTFTGGILALDDCATNTVDESLLDLSPYIKNSTAAISVFVDEAQTMTWGTALAAQTVDAETGRDGGLTKLGTGTLTLSAAPKYTGWTTVKAGKLIVPAGTALDVVAGAGGEIEGATTNDLAFAEGYVFNAGTDGQIVATGEADVSNLKVYIANPTASGSFKVVKAGSITGTDTATLKFPAETDEKVKAKWSLRSGNGTLKASSVVPFAIIVR